MGTLFKVRTPKSPVRKVAESCITQALLTEPGCAQKAFALLTFWEANSAQFERPVLAHCIETLVRLHETRGASSDLAWALAFCIQHRLALSRRSSRALACIDDDTVALLALHADAESLLPGFAKKSMSQLLRGANPDGDHWLLLYESVRQGYLPSLHGVVAGNPLLGDLLNKGVAFYRQSLPAYALLVHPGGAPEWVVSAWLKAATSAEPATAEPIIQMIREDAESLETAGKTFFDLLLELLDTNTEHPTAGLEPYA